MKHQANISTLLRVSLLAMAVSYIVLFIIYGAILIMPENLAMPEKAAWIADNAFLLNATYIIGYVFFACLLTLVTLSFAEISKVESKTLSQFTAAFGYFWAVMLLCTGMIGITSTNMMGGLLDDPAMAAIVYQSSAMLSDSLGGGIEFVGGVWVFLIGLIGLKFCLLGKYFSVFSLFKGLIGIITLFSTDILLRVAFGLTGIVWVIWFAFAIAPFDQRRLSLLRGE